VPVIRRQRSSLSIRRLLRSGSRRRTRNSDALWLPNSATASRRFPRVPSKILCSTFSTPWGMEMELRAHVCEPGRPGIVASTGSFGKTNLVSIPSTFKPSGGRGQLVAPMFRLLWERFKVRRHQKGSSSRLLRSRMRLTQYATNVTPRVVLIDGELIAELMIDNSLGVSAQEPYVVKRIDSDYFDEDV
jgi:hypothetical protein